MGSADLLTLAAVVALWWAFGPAPDAGKDDQGL
jgi:hypothetical protein